MDSSPAPDLFAKFLTGRDEPCPQCGYNLRDAKGSRCPECGHALHLAIQARRTGASVSASVVLWWAVLGGVVSIAGEVWMSRSLFRAAGLGQDAWRLYFQTREQFPSLWLGTGFDVIRIAVGAGGLLLLRRSNGNAITRRWERWAAYLCAGLLFGELALEIVAAML